jgi:glutathione S-transferase
MSDQRIASNDLTVWTYDWVPEGPRGHVRDIRPRWALEEVGLDYAVRTVPFIMLALLVRSDPCPHS